VDEFIEKLAADQNRLRDHLRGQVLRFQKMGESLNRVKRKRGRLFVVGEGNLDDLSRLIADEFLRQWPVVPVSLFNSYREDFVDVEAPENPVRVSKSVPKKVREFAQHFMENDVILAFIHEGKTLEIKKALKLAKRAGLRVLAIGGLDARDVLRDYCYVFLPIPTRGIKTICEASFICVRIMGRYARAGKLEKEVEQSELKVKEAWGGLKKVGEQATKNARKKIKDSSGLAERKGRRARDRDGSGEVQRKKKTSKLDRKRSMSGGAETSTDRDGSGERSKEKVRGKKTERRALSQSSEKRSSNRQTKRDKAEKAGAKRSSSLKKTAKSARLGGQISSRTAKLASSEKAGQTADISASAPSSRGSASKSKIQSRELAEDKIITPSQLESSDVNEISLSEIENAVPLKRRPPPGPAVSGELIPPKWLEDNESVQEPPIGMGSSFKSSGILGDLGLQSDDLMPRYIRDALDPNSIPMPSAPFVQESDSHENAKARFVSNRFQVQECTLRFAVGGFPDELVPEHSLIKLSPSHVSFSLGSDDTAAQTLTQGDELWLRIEVPAFLEPILARAAIQGFETMQENDGLRFNLQFTVIPNDVRRKIKIAAESLATAE
jgi:hypothetical protein